MVCSIDKREHRGIPVAYLRGDVELATCPWLGETLASLAEPPNRCLILELSEVTYVDSTAIGCFFEVQHELQANRGHLAVVCCNPPLERLLAEVGFDKVLNLYADLDAAADALLPLCGAQRA